MAVDPLPPARSAPRGQGLIVGASSDLGAAIAAELAGRHDRLVLWGRDAGRLDEAAAGCARTPVDRRIVEVRDQSAMTAAVAELRANGPLRTVVWAAGVFDWGPADGADPERWREVIEVNLTAPTAFTPMVLPSLIEAAPSSLIYLGSGAGHQAFPNNASYVASKHGLAGLARATYLDVRRHRVKVALISPGPVAAGATLAAGLTEAEQDRLLQPEDVAAAVGFVVGFPDRGCPTEIRLQPNQLPPAFGG